MGKTSFFMVDEWQTINADAILGTKIIFKEDCLILQLERIDGVVDHIRIDYAEFRDFHFETFAFLGYDINCILTKTNEITREKEREKSSQKQLEYIRNEVAPCHKCGGRAIVKEDEIYCEDCGYSIKDDNIGRAFENWNEKIGGGPTIAVE